MSESRFRLFRVTPPAEGMPAYTGLIEVPRAGLYWIDGYVDRLQNGETFIRGELAIYSGSPPKGRRALPGEAQDGHLIHQPGFWPVSSKRRR